MELVRKLRQRSADGRPVAVGIIGCGQMGSGLAHTVSSIDGMTVRVIADIAPQRAIDTFRDMGAAPDDIATAESVADAADALSAGKVVVTPDPLLPTQLEAIECNVEVTGVPDVGAAVAVASIDAGRPIVMLNVETDITIGLLLDRRARAAGSLYTVASGDEPGVCKMLHEQAVLMGFEVVCLGKGKNNPIDRAATAETCHAEAASKDMNPKVLAGFKDGTKTMVEMAAVANATGLLPDRPGMHGPFVDLPDLVAQFRPAVDGGIFSRRGCVDYTTGPIAPGVFAVVYSDNARIRKDMKFITRAQGPYYLHFRPYHLCDLETPQSIAEAVLLGEVTVTAEAMHTEVVAIAKRDLAPGGVVQGIGGADWYGLIYTADDARAIEGVPIGLAAGGTVTAPVAKGEPLTTSNFAPRTDTLIHRLRAEQDAMLEVRA